LDKRQKAIEIFCSGVESVKPDNLINSYVSVHKNILQIEKITFDLLFSKNIYVIGAGKASAMMARAIESTLGTRITAGHIIFSGRRED
jgi:glycerate 2-kinase